MEKSYFVLSKGNEILESARDLGLESCSDCGKEFELKPRTGILGFKSWLKTWIHGKKSNIRRIENFPNEETKAYCLECGSYSSTDKDTRGGA